MMLLRLSRRTRVAAIVAATLFICVALSVSPTGQVGIIGVHRFASAVVGDYFQLSTVNAAAPASADCDAAGETGRVHWDSTNDRPRFCSGASGWVSLATTGAIVTKTANYTITEADDTVLCDATAGAVVLALPAVAALREREFTMKKIDASANACTFDGNGAEAIDGAATLAITTQWESVTAKTNATAWFIK